MSNFFGVSSMSIRFEFASKSCRQVRNTALFLRSFAFCTKPDFTCQRMKVADPHSLVTHNIQGRLRATSFQAKFQPKKDKCTLLYATILSMPRSGLSIPNSFKTILGENLFLIYILGYLEEYSHFSAQFLMLLQLTVPMSSKNKREHWELSLGNDLMSVFFLNLHFFPRLRYFSLGIILAIIFHEPDLMLTDVVLFFIR